jgi:hypothetical protein
VHERPGVVSHTDLLDLTANEEVKRQMSEHFHKKALPAVGFAVGAGVLAHRANANAAQALGVPVVAIALLVAVAIAVMGALA